MAKQNFWGAVEQYWTLEDKPRLHRRNTYFEDHPSISNWTSFKIGIVAVTTITIVICGIMVGGMI